MINCYYSNRGLNPRIESPETRIDWWSFSATTPLLIRYLYPLNGRIITFLFGGGSQRWRELLMIFGTLFRASARASFQLWLFRTTTNLNYDDDYDDDDSAGSALKRSLSNNLPVVESRLFIPGSACLLEIDRQPSWRELVAAQQIGWFGRDREVPTCYNSSTRKINVLNRIHWNCGPRGASTFGHPNPKKLDTMPVSCRRKARSKLEWDVGLKKTENGLVKRRRC